jgi:signal transduction histidine kinase
MKLFPFKGNSLLWRILLSTSIAVTAVFALTGWMVQRYATTVSRHSLEEEIRTSLQAYEAMWSARVHNLTELSSIMSSMSDVRAAFATRDRLTIQDVAEQLWSRVSDQDASFLVLDPTGEVIASLGGPFDFTVNPSLIRQARTQFPHQVSGYATRGRRLYYVVLTPVYVQAMTEQALLNVLLIAFDIDTGLAQELKRSTHGSEFAFLSGNAVMASTLSGITAADLRSGKQISHDVKRMEWKANSYLLLGTSLQDIAGGPIGELFVIRSFARPQETVSELRRNVAVFWIAGIVVALLLTYLLSRRILEPVKRLDRAAEEVSKRNYDYRVPVETTDELGRLATTFNEMCDSIQRAREDLIHQEQIATIGRLSGSIVHDLRNPLAAIYGGAEMLVDAELSSEQQRRLAANIYSSSRRIQELLQELLDVSQAKARAIEPCNLADIVLTAREAAIRSAELRGVSIQVDISHDIEVVVSRDRLERVFINLIDNAIDAMPSGGSVKIKSWEEDDAVVVLIEDTGPGIPAEALPNLFRPFGSFGKKNGLGLGLALSRQALLDSGGDLWVDPTVASGARFIMRLPMTRHSVEAKMNSQHQ